MYSEAKKAYNVQYVKDKIKRIPLDVQREHYERIKAAADVAGESVNGYIKRAIDERMEQDRTQEGAGTAQASGVFLSTATVETAQEAAQAVGEDTARFISRAVETQAQEDIRVRLNEERQEQTTDALIREIEDTARLVTSTLWGNIFYNGNLYKKPKDALEVRAALVECKQRTGAMLDNLIKTIDAHK